MTNVESRHATSPRATSLRAAAFLLGSVIFAGATVALGACTRTAPAASAASASVPRYTPRTRDITVTTVPLLVKEEQKVLPFLRADFAKGGVLDGKEVYAFSPSTITVVEGDTIHFTFVNPEDDEHSFVLPDLAVQLPGQQVKHATYVAKRAGIYPFLCSVPSHLPMMSGELVVLAPEVVQ